MDEGSESGDVGALDQRHIIRRPRLERLLDETEARIIMLVAPAGYGKTTLARQWLGTRDCVWYRATAASADVAEFAHGIVATAAEALGTPAQTRYSIGESPVDVDALAAHALATLRNWPSNVWLVIDDYHLAAENNIEQLVGRIVDSAPTRILLTSRQRPSWATPRRILYGEMLEIGPLLLALNAEEAAAVLAGRPADDLPGLLALSEGWPAVIGLAAMVEAVPSPPARLPSTLFEFFAEELYRVHPVHERRALCMVAWVTDISLAQASQLLQDDHLPGQLATAQVISATAGGLALHPLMRTFLRDRSLTDLDRDDLSVVYGRLVEWEAWDDAHALCVAFGLTDAHLALLEVALERLLERGRVATVERWAEHLRRSGATHAIIELTEAQVALRHGAYGEAEAAALRAAEQAESAALKSRAFTAAGRSAHLDSRQRRALEHYRRAQDEAATDAERWPALWGELTAAGEDDHDSLLRLIDKIERYRTAEPERQLRLETARLFAAYSVGGVADSLARGRAAAPLMTSVADPFVRSSYLNALGHALVYAAEYGEALGVAENEFADASAHGLTFVLAHAKVVEALALVGLRRFAEAASALEAAAETRSTHDRHAHAAELLTRTRLALSLGDTEAALHLIEKPPKTMPSRATEAEWLATRAIVFHAAGRPPDHADAAVRDAHALNPNALARTLLIMSGAASRLRRGVASRATTAFEEVAALGYYDSIVFACRAFPPLLRALAEDETLRWELELLLARARDHDAARQVNLSVARQLDPREVLSPREREVYELLAGGLSNREIAQRLFISDVTVKVHVRHILEKLGVRTRTQAALIATRAPRD